MTVDVFDLSAKIKLDITEYEKGLNTASRDSHSVASKIGSGLGKAAKVGGAALGAASAAAGAFMKKSLEAGKQFDSSMSQVGATLGYSVEEINDETTEAGKNMKQLRDFAQEMGRKTKFSATESADALNYMALAGYDAEKSMSMLPTVLNMASAGNMDLATASDMVTDAQTALNLSMDDTAKMTDQMAKAASSSNTSVSQLGSAFLTVGATARSVKGGTKEMSQVLGLMADNGIKGSEAGTKYRNMLLKLIKPTKDGAGLLHEFSEKLGHDLVFDEKTHEMRSFEDIFLDLNKAMGDMAKGDKDKIMANLFNTRDLSAANALLGTTRDRWEELGAKIDDSVGSAEKMAGVQLDNLQGDVTLFKSAWEGLQIAVSDGAMPAVRDFVKFGTDGVSRLADAMKNGGVGEAFSVLGDIISDGVKKLVKGFPKLIEAGGRLLSSLGKGIVKAAPELTKALLDTVTKLADSLVDGLPAFVNGGIEIATSIINGIAQAAPNLIPKVVDIVLNLADALINNIPTIVNAAINLIMGVAQGIIKAIPRIVKAIPTLIKSLVNAILNAIPQIIQAGIDLLTSLVESLPEIINTIVAAIPEIITGIIDAFMDNIDSIIDAGFDLLTALIDDLPKIITTIVEAIPKIIEGIFKAITDPNNLKKIVKGGLKLAGKIVEGILSIVGKLPKMLWELIKGIISALTDPKKVIGALWDAGKAIIGAVWDGLKAVWDQVVGWITGIVEWATQQFKKIINAAQEMAEAVGIGISQYTATEQQRERQLRQERNQKVINEFSRRGLANIGYRVENNSEGNTRIIHNGKDVTDQYVKLAAAPNKSLGSEIMNLRDADTKEITTAQAENNDKIIMKLDELGDRITNSVDKSGNTTIQINGRDFGRAVRTYA